MRRVAVLREVATEPRGRQVRAVGDVPDQIVCLQVHPQPTTGASFRARSAFAQQHRLCFLVNLPRMLRGVTHRRQPDPAALGQTADHVEDHARLVGLVEVQATSGHDVEQVGDRQRLEPADSKWSVATRYFRMPPAAR